MSTVLDAQPRIRKRYAHTTPALQAAIVAAISQGMPQAEAAQHFNVHRNTVGNICRNVREQVKNPANPLSEDWKSRIVPKIQQAVESAIDCKDDLYKSADVALKAGKGIGYFTETSVQVNFNSTLSAIPDELSAEMVLTPGDVIEHDTLDVVEHKMLGSGEVNTPPTPLIETPAR